MSQDTRPTAPPRAETTPGRRAQPRRSRSVPPWRVWVPYAVFLVVSIAAVSLHMSKFHEISPIDEGVHYDYIENLPHVPSGGEKMDQDALRETACRTYGPDFPPQVMPKCGDTPYDPNLFPSAGFSTAGTTPPVYYVVTGVVARPLAFITPWSVWDISRALGALWLTGLMSVSYLLALRLGASRTASLGAALFVGLATDVVSSAATIGPDVATAISGGVVFLAVLAYDGTRRRTLMVLGAVLLASLVKFTSFTAVGAGILMLLIGALQGPADELRRRLARRTLLSVGMLGVFGVSSLLWGLRYRATNVIDVNTIPMNQIFLADKIRWEDINSTLYYTFMTPNAGNWNATFLESSANGRLEALLIGILGIGVLGAALTFRHDWRIAGLGWGVLVLAVLGPLMLTLLNFYANGLFFGIPPRYGFALLPGMAALTAWVLRSPGPAKALVALGLLSGLSLFL